MCLAVPGRIVAIDEADELAFRRGKVDFSGILKEVSLALTPEARLEDYVLVHAGFALNVVDEEEAHRVFGYLREMEALADAEDATP